MVTPIKLFYYFFIIFGGVLVIFGIYYSIISNEASEWPSVDGTIGSTSIRTHYSTMYNATPNTNTSTKTYYPEITYSWLIDGQSYEGKRYGFGYSHPDYSEKSEAKKAAKNYRTGQVIEVFYNPKNPEQAVIDRSEMIVSYIPLLMGIFFSAVGVLFLKLSPQLEEGYHRYMEAQKKPK